MITWHERRVRKVQSKASRDFNQNEAILRWEGGAHVGGCLMVHGRANLAVWPRVSWWPLDLDLSDQQLVALGREANDFGDVTPTNNHMPQELSLSDHLSWVTLSSRGFEPSVFLNMCNFRFPAACDSTLQLLPAPSWAGDISRIVPKSSSTPQEAGCCWLLLAAARASEKLLPRRFELSLFLGLSWEMTTTAKPNTGM